MILNDMGQNLKVASFIFDLAGPSKEALRDHRTRMLAEGHADDLVFVAPEGGRIRANNLLRRWYKP